MIRTFWELLAPEARKHAALHLVLTVLSAAARAVGAVLLIPLITELFSEEPADAWPWVGTLVIVTVVGWILDWTIARLAYRIGFGLLETSQSYVAQRLTQVPLNWLKGKNLSTARQAIAATGPDVVGFVGNIVTPLLSAILLPALIGLALLPVAWQLGVMALLGVPLMLGALWAAGRMSRKADKVAEQTNAALTERIIEFARTQQALRAARRVKVESSTVSSALSEQHGATMKLILMQLPGQLIFSIASQIALILLAGCTIVLVFQQQLGPEQAIGMIVVLVRYLEPFTAAATLSGAIENSTTVLGRIQTVLQAPAEHTGTRTQLTGPHTPRLELSNVTFRYDDDGPAVVKNMSLTFEPGTTTAIVGPSGSGKSTILALLSGLQTPTEGHVLINGQDAAEFEASARTALASVVFQEPYLFEGTVKENIRNGYARATEQQLLHVAALAKVDVALQGLPKGWDSEVGEAGTQLSGGERQRVSLARALISPAPILLIDEATSALDAENEAAVTAALTENHLARTKIIVAHRLTSIKNADRVIFMDHGRIIEDGSIEELKAAGKRFAQFWEHQQAAANWQL